MTSSDTDYQLEESDIDDKYHFRKSDNLNGENYPCTTSGCDLKFRRRDAFDKHVFTHTGVVRLTKSSKKLFLLINLQFFYRKNTTVLTQDVLKHIQH